MDSDINKKLQEAKEWLQKEFSGIRTGQANPALLDSVRVESYGAMTPINQIGSVGAEDARTLRISPWDISQAPAIERALREADLGVSIMTDSSGLRVVFPELTVERRAQLLKLAKTKLEDSRITVRAIRDEEMKQIEKSEKSGDISEDEKFSRKETTQQLIDKTNRELDTIYAQKELELNK